MRKEADAVCDGVSRGAVVMGEVEVGAGVNDVSQSNHTAPLWKFPELRPHKNRHVFVPLSASSLLSEITFLESSVSAHPSSLLHSSLPFPSHPILSSCTLINAMSLVGLDSGYTLAAIPL